MIQGQQKHDVNNELSSENLKKMFGENPALALCLDRFVKARDHDSKYFQKIDEWRKFFDEIFIDNEDDNIGGQVARPLLKKLYKGMNHPEGKLEKNQSVSADEVVFAEAHTRSEVARHKLDKLWKENRGKSKKDGVVFQVIKVDPETGKTYSVMRDRKKILFDEHAEDIHPITDDETGETSQGATWKFEMSVVRGESFREKNRQKYPDTVDLVRKGSPIEAIHDTQGNTNSLPDPNENEFGDDVTILDVQCLSSPIDMELKVGTKTKKIKRGDPFQIKIAGGNCVFLYCISGEEWKIFRWAHKKTKRHPNGEPFFPVLAYFDTEERKGLQCLSFTGLAKPYLKRLIRLEGKVDKHIDIMADPDFVLNFKRSGSGGTAGNEDGADDQVASVKDFVALNLRKKLEGKKTTNYILTDTEDGVDIDMVQATPTNLDLGKVEERIERLKRELSDNVGIIHNDTSYDENSKVGILRYKEEEQNGSIGEWQGGNENTFALFNMMVLNFLFTIQSVNSDREIEIKDKGLQGDFVYKKKLSELKEQLSESILSLKWSFAFSRPDGALQAAAEKDSFDQMDMLHQRFNMPIPTLEKAMFNSTAKQISLEYGTEAFSPEEAFNDLQRSRQSLNPEGEGEAEMGENFAHFNEKQIENYLMPT